MTTLDKFDQIVADAGYGSEYNYSLLEDKYSNKKYYIPYTMYEKKQTRKYKNDPTKLINWFYDEKDDYYLDQNGVKFTSNIIASARSARLVKYVILRSMKQMKYN